MGASLLLVAVVVAAALALWPPVWDSTLATLLLLYVVAASHPVLVRHATRSEFIFLNEMAVAVAVFALPPERALWVVLLGAMATPFVVVGLSPLERMRRAPLSRHLLNVSANTLGSVPMVALAATARPFGPLGTSLAVLVGILLHGVLTHLLVTTAIHTSTRRPAGASIDDAMWSPAALALGMGAMSIPLGLTVRTYDPDWPLVLALGVTLVTVSRARMDRDHASHQLAAVTNAARGFTAAASVSQLDARLADALRDVLQCAEVEVGAATEPAAGDRSAVWSHLAGAGWVVARQPAMGARWTRLDHELLSAVVAVAAPQRERLELLRQTMEAERFASLVLATAGHDITNQLHAATMAIGTATRWSDRLDDDDRTRLADQAVRAIHRASNSLRDLVAIGARGPGATTTTSEIALFVRGLGAEIHVVCDNVTLATPAAVIERALENLVRNAQRHHIGAEPLQVRLIDDGPEVRIEVCDRGPGLAADHVETLFAPFAQLADDRGRRGSLGLGLFIARGLAESVGGSLDYRDRDGGGAVFMLRVPSVAKDASERVHERIVLGPRPDGHAQAALQPGLGGEVADEDALAE